MKLFPPFIALTLLAAVPALAQSSLTYTGSFADIEDFAVISDFDEGTGAAFGTFSVVGGIPKFDPSLGTLTGIRVSAAYEYDAGGDFSIDSVTDQGSSYFAEVDSIFHEVGINLRRSSEPGTRLVIQGVTQVFQDSYFVFEPDFVDGFADGGLWDFSFDEEDIFGSADPTDFIGTGNVDVLDAAIYLPAEGQFTLDNVDSVTLETYGSLYDGEVRVTYDYIPIPEPGAAVLAISAFGLGLARRRRA